jgi:queuine tRNA-ribosyltransferase
MILSQVNLAYYQEMVAGARTAIAEGRLEAYAEETRAGWSRGDLPPL